MKDPEQEPSVDATRPQRETSPRASSDEAVIRRWKEGGIREVVDTTPVPSSHPEHGNELARDKYDIFVEETPDRPDSDQ